jgi:radical SAM protein with 4Fe4S-binding SPASM domain
MPLSLYSAILKDVGDSLERVYLWNYGEPLLNPKAMDMLELLRHYSVAGFLSTTGLGFQRKQDWSPLTALAELIVSINGLDETTYAFHQQGGTLAGVSRGLTKIGELMAGARTRFVLQFVAHKNNLHQIPQLMDFARRYGFKQVCVKSFSVMDGLQSTFRDFVPDNSKFSRYVAKDTDLSVRQDPCRHWMVINHNGDVLPCCFDYNSEIVLGNARAGIKAVWASDLVQRHLQQIDQHQYYHFCDACVRKATVYRKDV